MAIWARGQGETGWTNNGTCASTATGEASVNARRTRAGRPANATIKLSRYSASGATHSSGIGAISADRNVVTPNMRLDGTSASATHRAFRPAPMSEGPRSGAGRARADAGAIPVATAHA